MPDFGRNQEPSLEDIHRSDSFIDALANGLPLEPADQADAALAAMLGGWRDENRWPPDAGLISEPQAIAALDAGLAEKRSGPKKLAPTPITAAPRNRRGLSVVGAAAAAMLAIGGFGAVVSGAGPGDSLYGLRTMLFGAPKQVRDDQVALAARTEMQQVQEMISRGDWQQAEQKLVAVSNQVAGIADEQQKQELLDQFNNLSAKVVERDPEATPPPGITYTVPPSATELVPAPVTTSSTTSASATDSATTTSASPSSPGTTTPTSASATSTAATTSAATTSAAATSVPSTSAPSTTVTTSAAATSATTTTAKPSTPTTSAATTTAATTSAATTSAPASAAATTTATTTAAPAKSAATTTTTTAPAAAAATTTTTTSVAAPAPASATGSTAVTTATPATSSAPAPAKTSAPAAAATSSMTTAGGAAPAQVVTPTTTTVPVPVPAA